MDKIIEAQYKNLRECFNKNLVKPILGKNYYTMAMDVYGSDEEATLSLKWKFENQKYNIKKYKLLFIVSLLINIALIIWKVVIE